MQSEDLLIEIKNLKTYFPLDEGTVKAVDGATFDIRRSETLGVVGESGCGKSMLARSLLRIVDSPGRIVEGEILYHKAPQAPSGPFEIVDIAKLAADGPEIRAIRGAHIAMIFQEPMTALSPVYTIGNQIIEAIQQHRRVSTHDGAPKPSACCGRWACRCPSAAWMSIPISSRAVCASAP